MQSRITMFCLELFLGTGLLAQQAAPAAEAETPKSDATMVFDQETFEYGTILQGEVVKNVFEFENTGTEALVIMNAKGSCGCTVPEWPKDPILPGETGQLLVQFDSKGKMGKQSKRVTLTTNGQRSVVYLTIKGEILDPAKQEELAASSILNAPIKNDRVDVNSFKLYPNPTSDILQVELGDYIGASAQIDIFNQKGQLMASELVAEITASATEVNVSTLASGMYTVSIKVKDKKRVAQLISIVR